MKDFSRARKVLGGNDDKMVISEIVIFKHCLARQTEGFMGVQRQKMKENAAGHHGKFENDRTLKWFARLLVLTDVYFPSLLVIKSP